MLFNLLTAIAAALMLFASLVSWAMLRILRGLRFKEPAVEAMECEHVPQDVRALLAPGAAQLIELGFVEAAAMKTSAQLVGGVLHPQHSLVFTHAKLPAVAYLAQQVGPQREREFTIQFASRREDGSGLVTRNRMSVGGPLPLANIETNDCWLPSWEKVWRAHVRRLKGATAGAAPWRRLSGAQAVAVSAHSEKGVFREHVKRGELIAEHPGVWRLSLSCSLRMLVRSWCYLLPSLRRMQPHPMPQTESVQAMVDAYERDMQQQRSQRWSQGAKWLLFAASGALALASFGVALDGGALLGVMVVLLFHELGHLIAMRWAGYQDLKVFFLPFLGAAVSGRHERPTLRQELIVLYAGPLPGLAIGLIGLLVIDPSSAPLHWGRELATLAVVINALNLLPVHPLDGGKIFELLVLGRWPWLAFSARVVGIAALGALALSTESGPGQVALLALALLMLFGVTHLWREARVARSVQRSGLHGGMDRQAALYTLFERMTALGYGALHWSNQRLIVGALLPGLTRPRTRAAARMGGAMLYGVLLAGALLAVGISAFLGVRSEPQMAGTATSVEAQDVDSKASARWLAERGAEIESLRHRVAAEPDLQRRWALLEPQLTEIALHVAAIEPGQLMSGVALLREARELASQVADRPASVATAEMALSEASRDPEQRLRHIEAAIAAYDVANVAITDPRPLLLATSTWLNESPNADALERKTRIERSLALVGGHATARDLFVLHAAHVDVLLALDDRARARELLHEVSSAATAPEDVVQATLLRVDATWADQGAASALTVLDDALRKMAAPAPTNGNLSSGAPATLVLLRRGMWIAEDAGRLDWQRDHVQALADAQAPASLMPFWLRALTWFTGGVNVGAGSTLSQLEYAHWRGDEVEARRIANELRQRAINFWMPLGGYHGGQQFIGPHIRERMTAVRRRLAERYGLPLREPADHPR